MKKVTKINFNEFWLSLIAMSCYVSITDWEIFKFLKVINDHIRRNTILYNSCDDNFIKNRGGDRKTALHIWSNSSTLKPRPLVTTCMCNNSDHRVFLEGWIYNCNRTCNIKSPPLQQKINEKIPTINEEAKLQW